MKRSNLKSLAVATLFALASVASVSASAYQISTPGLSGPFSLSPSADTVSLNAGSATTANLGSFAFQSGNYFVGDSGFLTGTFNYNVNEQVSIDGQSLSVPLSLVNRVSNPNQENTDSLSISQADPVFFSDANVFFNFASYQSPNVGVIGQNTPFTLSGFLAAGPVAMMPVSPPPEVSKGEVPEPSSIALMLAGSLGLVGMVRRRRAAVKA